VQALSVESPQTMPCGEKPLSTQLPALSQSLALNQ